MIIPWYRRAPALPAAGRRPSLEPPPADALPEKYQRLLPVPPKSRFYGFADRRLRAAAWRWLFVVGPAEI